MSSTVLDVFEFLPPRCDLLLELLLPGAEGTGIGMSEGLALGLPESS